MPTHRAGQEIQQDPIRLKNLLTEAEERLLAAGLRRSEVEERLAPARALVQNVDFWQHQAEGLAILIGRDLFRTYRLPRLSTDESASELTPEFGPLVFVGERFHVKPLLPVLSGGGHFYLLALSLGQVRLYEGARWDIEEVDLAEGPESLQEALRYDDPERQLQFHTSTREPGGVGQRPATFHGQGIEDDEKENILRFFHRLDAALQPALADGEPLLLAGVEYLLPLYREANSYAHLVEEAVEVDPEALGSQELHERAWRILEPRFAAGQREAAARYEALAGAGSERASDALEQVVPAAYRARVDALFLAAGMQRWGAFDADANTVHVRGGEAPGAKGAPGEEDLLDFAAIHTLLNGGDVYLVAPGEAPGGGDLAALFRY
jgi:hypothetical protein